MITLIFSIIFIISLGAVLFILTRKIPVLNTLPKDGGRGIGIKKHGFILSLEDRFSEMALVFRKQILLHKILSWAKCWVLKIEVKIDHLLHNIRKKAQESKKK